MFEVQKHAISFSNPHIPYKWEHLEKITGAYFFIFDQYFFQQFAKLNQYAVYQPGGKRVFELPKDQISIIKKLFLRMFEEINSDYQHKYDVLRTIVVELIHFSLKLHSTAKSPKQAINASQRISTLFIELLERQFPIDTTHHTMQLRSASDFASQLHVLPYYFVRNALLIHNYCFLLFRV